MTPITPENLKATGYRVYYDRDAFKVALFLKTVWGDDKKLYFLQCQQWQFFGMSTSFAWEVTFYLPSDAGNPMSFRLATQEGNTIEEVEAFFARVYKKLGCVPDALNND